MKVAVIADAHIGKSNDSKILLDASEKFFTDVFFPEIKRRQIDVVIDLGDTFDRRKYINFSTLRRAQTFFLEPMLQFNYWHITGNHEVYHKHTNEVNTLESLFNTHMKPLNWKFINDAPFTWNDLTFMPWICEQNIAACLPYLENGGKALFAHLDFDGFEMESGQLRDGGMDHKRFSKFKRVFTGHFHKQSRKDNVHYVGSVGQYTWGDYGDVRGFHVLDTETLETEFVPNDFSPFAKVYYDDSTDTLVEKTMASMRAMEGKFVKLVVKHKTNPAVFDAAIGHIQKQTNEINVVDAHMHADDVPEIEIAPAEDTLSILRRYVENVPPDVDRLRVTNILEELYREAQDQDLG